MLFYVDNFNNKFLIILNKYERGRAKAKKAVKIILSISVIARHGFLLYRHYQYNHYKYEPVF